MNRSPKPNLTQRDLEGPLKFAMPAVTSRLHAGSANILGISCLTNESPLVMTSPHLILFQLRATDIPQAIAKRWIECGLCSLDAVVESQLDLRILKRFPETTTRIGLIESPRSTSNRHNDFYCVVTEYPVIAQTHLEKHYDHLEVWKAHGSCESFAFFENVNGVVDIVDSGKTLRRNGLILREILMETCICLVAGPDLDSDRADDLLHQIRESTRRLVSAQKSR